MKIKGKVYQRERALDMLPNGFVNTSLPDYPIWAPERAGQPQASPLGQGIHCMAENTQVTYSQAAWKGGTAGEAESHMTVFFHILDLLGKSHLPFLWRRKCFPMCFPPGRWLFLASVNVYSRVSVFPSPNFFLLTYWTWHWYYDQ